MEPPPTINPNMLTCRTCLENSNTTNSLFDAVEYETNMELKDVLEIVASVVVSSNQTMKPLCICFECTVKLLDAYEFIRTVEKSEHILKLHMENPDPLIMAQSTKVEFIEDAQESGEEDVQDLEVLDEEFQLADENALQSVGDESESSDVKYLPDELDEEESVFCEDFDTTQATVKNEKVENKIKDNKSSSPRPTKAKSKSNHSIGSRLNTYETSNWHKCDGCYRTFAKKQTLERHIQLAHTYATPEQIAAVAPKPTEAQPINCQHCPRLFKRPDNLQRHLLAMHASEPDVMAMEQENQKKVYTYKRGICPYCGDSFSAASLIIHIRRHTGEKPYKCDECGKGFPRKQDLSLHKRQHTGERPHLCTVCGKSFIRPNKLTRHMRIHTGVRPYKCTQCDKGFCQSNDLKIHMRRHTGEKPFKCGVCGEGFICGTMLKNHRRIKSHFTNDDDAFDPYADIRVTNRCHVLTAVEEQDIEVIEEDILVDEGLE